MKQFVRAALNAGPLQRLTSVLVKDRPTIFMLHRFAWPERGVVGHNPVVLRQALQWLRTSGVKLMGLHPMFTQLAEGRPFSKPTVAFTIDDGYLDQAMIGAPCFSEFDCPVTTFVTSGYLDRQLWFWWDRIEAVFRRTARTSIQVQLGETPLSYQWSSIPERDRAQADFTARCKEVPDAVKHAAIAALAVAADVELPEQAPEDYAPMSWDELRAAARGTMNFGPHTVTHPILARTPDDQARFELTESWKRLSAECAQPTPIFCYPNGRTQDFSTRETGILKEVGIMGAVVGESGYASGARFRSGGDQPYRVRRFAYDESPGALTQIATGVERLKQVLRRED